MEFTNWEQKVMSPRHETEIKISMWVGIVLIALSIASVPFIIQHYNETIDKWESQYSTLNNDIEAQTALEVKLKGLILEDTVSIGNLSIALFVERAGWLALLFFTIGAGILGKCLSARYYNKLIKKLMTDKRVPLTHTLENEYIGLEEIDDGIYNVYYCDYLIGRFFEEILSVKDVIERVPIRLRKAKECYQRP